MSYDFSQYGSWQRIKAPSGAEYYVVPNTNYLYDPITSQMKGRPVLWQNPTPLIEEKQRLEKQQKEMNSPLNQAMPLLGSIGGTLAGKWAIEELGPPSAADKLLEQAAANMGTNATSGISSAVGSSPLTTNGLTQSASYMDGGAGAITSSGELVPVPYGGESLASQLPTSSGLYNIGNSTLADAGGTLAILKGGYDTYQAFQHGGKGARTGMAETGAGIGTLVAPGIGTVAGAIIGNLLGAAGKKFGLFGGQDSVKTEWNRKKKLYDQGVIGLNELGPEPQQGQSHQQLIDDAVATGGNVDFARTRNEEYLKPVDIVGYATFAEHDPNWYKKSLEERLNIAQKALDAKAVREHHGTVDVDWSKVSS